MPFPCAGPPLLRRQLAPTLSRGRCVSPGSAAGTRRQRGSFSSRAKRERLALLDRGLRARSLDVHARASGSRERPASPAKPSGAPAERVEADKGARTARQQGRCAPPSRRTVSTHRNPDPAGWVQESSVRPQTPAPTLATARSPGRAEEGARAAAAQGRRGALRVAPTPPEPRPRSSEQPDTDSGGGPELSAD